MLAEAAVWAISPWEAETTARSSPGTSPAVAATAGAATAAAATAAAASPTTIVPSTPSSPSSPAATDRATNTVGQLPQGVGNNVESDTNSLASGLGGSSNLLGGLVQGLGSTLNNKLQQLGGNR